MAKERKRYTLSDIEELKKRFDSTPLDMHGKVYNMLQVLKMDESLSYKPAVVIEDPSLALRQHGLICQINLLEELLGEPKTLIPLKK